MKRILDKMFGNKKLSIIVPISLAVLAYFLFVFFGAAEARKDLVIIIPFVSVICFFGIFLVVFIQVKNPMCPEWFLNLGEVLIAIPFGLAAVVGLISFFLSSFANFNIGICLGFVSYSAVSWAHSKRAK